MAQFLAVGKLAKAYSAMKARTERVKEKAEETFSAIKKVGEVGAAAYGLAYANHRYGAIQKSDGTQLFLPEKEVMGVPIDLLATGVLTGGGILGAAGKYGEDAVNLGAGALACYLTRQAMTKANGDLLKAQQNAPKTIAGAGYRPGGIYDSQAQRQYAGNVG